MQNDRMGHCRSTQTTGLNIRGRRGAQAKEGKGSGNRDPGPCRTHPPRPPCWPLRRVSSCSLRLEAASLASLRSLSARLTTSATLSSASPTLNINIPNMGARVEYGPLPNSSHSKPCTSYPHRGHPRTPRHGTPNQPAHKLTAPSNPSRHLVNPGGLKEGGRRGALHELTTPTCGTPYLRYLRYLRHLR